MATEDLIQDPSYTTPDGTPLATLARNPHQNVDVVHGVTGGGTPESTIVLQLVDYVPEYTSEGGLVQLLNPSMLTETQLTGVSAPLWRDMGGQYPHPPYNLFNTFNSSTSFKWVAPVQTVEGKLYTVTSSINLPQPTIKVVFGSQEQVVTSSDNTFYFIGDGNLVDVGYVFGPNTSEGGVNGFYVEVQGDPVLVPSTCTSFVRKIVDGIVSDFESDGVTPYIVSGTILAHCPDLSGQCDCSSELTDIKQELVDIKALVQQLLNGQAPPPT